MDRQSERRDQLIGIFNSANWAPWVPFVIGFLMGIWVFTDARKRGVTNGIAFLCFLGTTVLGVIALIVWFIVRPELIRESVTACPKCRGFYHGSPVVCPNCGHILREGVIDLSSNESENSEVNVQ